MFLCATGLGAQVSLVPVRHPVYEWLRYQETLGRIDGYEHEALPLTRRELVEFLDQIGARRGDLTATEARALDSFRRELSLDGIEASAKASFVKNDVPFPQRIWRMHDGSVEPRLVAEVGEGYAFAFDVTRQPFGYRRVAEEGASPLTGFFGESRIRSVFQIGDHVGVHVEAGNVSTGRSNELLRYDPRYAHTSDVATRDQHAAIEHQAFVTARVEPLEVDLAHAPIRYGVGTGPSLLIGPDFSSHNWVRVRLDGRALRYTALTGALVGGADYFSNDTIFAGPDTVLTRQAPQRWLAMHRVDFLPSPDLEFSVTQMAVYGRRGIDLAASTPLGPALADRSHNTFWELEARARPHDGVTLDGALLLDDVGAPGNGVARGFDLGANLALRGGWELDVRGVRLDPFLYAADDTVDALQQRQQPMGYPLGPNAEELSVRARKWLPLRSWVAVRYGRVRKGLNPTGGGNVGGDVLLGTAGGSMGILEGADVQEYHEVEVEGLAEPWRGIALGVLARRRFVTTGARIPDATRLDVWVSFQSAAVEATHFVTGSIH